MQKYSLDWSQISITWEGKLTIMTTVSNMDQVLFCTTMLKAATLNTL
jgi:hypothetical protein